MTLSANSDGGAMLAGPAFKRKSEVLANSEHSILLGQDVLVSWNPRDSFSDILFDHDPPRTLIQPRFEGLGQLGISLNELPAEQRDNKAHIRSGWSRLP